MNRGDYFTLDIFSVFVFRRGKLWIYDYSKCEFSKKKCAAMVGCTLHRIGRVLSFFSSRLNWDSPNLSPAGECAPCPFGSGGRGTLDGERGGGRVPIPTRGHTLWYSIFISVLCGRMLLPRPWPQYIAWIWGGVKWGGYAWLEAAAIPVTSALSIRVYIMNIHNLLLENKYLGKGSKCFHKRFEHFIVRKIYIANLYV
jgi:hypothetical protein